MMKFSSVITPVVFSALALTGCSSTPAPAPTYTPASITVPAPVSSVPAAAPAKIAAPMDTITAPRPVVPAPSPAAIAIPATAPKVSAPKKLSVPAPVKRCEEDQPCWDCKTMGNKICGPTPAPVPATGWDCDTTGRTICYSPNLGDAWESFDAVDTYDSDVQPLAYVKTVHTAPKPARGFLVVKSINLPKTWHIFKFLPVKS